MDVKNLVSNDVAWMVEHVNGLYREGKIKGFTVQILQTNGEMITGTCGDISFLEKLGLIEMAKQDIFYEANS